MKPKIWIFILIFLSVLTTSCPVPHEVFTITFDLNGGEVDDDYAEELKPKKIDEGECLKYAALPTKGLVKGVYSFAGWTITKNGDDILTGDFMPERDMTLYAKWVDNSNNNKPKTEDNQVKVYFNHNDGTGKIDTTIIVDKLTELYSYRFPDVERTDYNLIGWANSSTGEPIEYSITITRDTTLYAIWESKTVKVYFYRNDGSVQPYTIINVERNQYLDSNKFPTPIWENYTLKGWAVSPNGELITNHIQITKDTTLYAIWNRFYKITFDINNGIGKTPDAKEIEEGEDLYSYSLPNNVYFSRDGYLFRGWSQTSTGAPISGSIKISNDITLYAVWSKKTYTISFDLNGGRGRTPDNMEWESGSDLYYGHMPHDSNFSREGYKFVGWAETPNGESLNYILVTGDITLYAVWWKIKCTISFDINGGRGRNPDSDEIEYGNYLYCRDLPDDSYFTKNGYSFEGWSEVRNGEPIANNLYITEVEKTLYAVWSRKKCTVYFDINGGIGRNPDRMEIEVGNYLYVSDLPNSDNFENNGYTFKGWSENLNGNPISSSFVITANITLHAVWKKNNCVISFDLNGGYGDTPEDIEVEQGAYYYVSDLPNDSRFERSGYVFKGWSGASDGLPFSSDSFRVGTSGTLYAVWKKICTISFDINGGRGITPEYKEIVEGEVLNLSDFPNNSGFSRTGYSFKGWSSDANAVIPLTRESYRTSGDVTLYAVWKKLHTIQFDLNGGSGITPDNIIIEDQEYLYYRDFPSGANLSRSGYTFKGWSEWANGNSIEYDIYVMEDKTLYAIWKRTKPQEPDEPQIIGGDNPAIVEPQGLDDPTAVHP